VTRGLRHGVGDAGLAAGRGIEVEVVPGVTGANAARSRARRPAGRGPRRADAVRTSSSLERIEAQLRAAAGAGLALALFNPASQGRPGHLARAREVLAEVLPSTTPVAIVTDATARPSPSRSPTCRPGGADPEIVGMRSLVRWARPDTRVLDGVS